MDNLTIDTTDAPILADIAEIDRGLDEFNRFSAPLDSVRPLICVARLRDGTLIGGVKSRTWGQCCEVQQIWVSAAYRRNGIGRRLMAETETEAARRGCRLVYLETFSFQVPEFYRRIGFETACEFHGFPDGIVKHILRKAIA